jgi:hypothetical protein
MTDLVSFGIVAVAVAVLGLFAIQRARARWRLLADFGGADGRGNVAARITGWREIILLNQSKSRKPQTERLLRENDAIVVSSSEAGAISAAFDSDRSEIEYYFHSKAGTLTIASIPGLPSAVELRVGGRIQGRFISAEFAASAVAEGQTDHKELNALPASERPQRLGDWEKSHSHHFRI